MIERGRRMRWGAGAAAATSGSGCWVSSSAACVLTEADRVLLPSTGGVDVLRLAACSTRAAARGGIFLLRSISIEALFFGCYVVVVVRTSCMFSQATNRSVGASQKRQGDGVDAIMSQPSIVARRAGLVGRGKGVEGWRMMEFKASYASYAMREKDNNASFVNCAWLCFVWEKCR